MERELRIELGRVWMTAEAVTALAEGSRVELPSVPGDRAELYVGARRIAQGEPALMDGKFCLRVTAVAAGPGRFVAADGEPAAPQQVY